MYIPATSKFVDRTQWRWNRILQLHRSGRKPSPPGDDLAVLRGVEFYVALRDADGDEEKERLVSLRFPHLYEAYILHTQADMTTESAIQGLLLANTPVAEISLQYETHPDVLNWYRSLWFDISPSATKTWVMTVLIPQVHRSGFNSDDSGFFSLLGASHGKDVLKDVLTREPITEKNIEAHRSLAHSMATYKGQAASVSLPLSAFHAGSTFDLYSQMDRSNRDLEAGGDSGLTALLNYIIGSDLQWQLMDKTTSLKGLHNPNVRAIEAGSASSNE
ncbi:MAG: hypothetical protein WC992_00270 [Acholeplasmataceae bacterium]